MNRTDRFFGIVAATAALMLLAGGPVQAKKANKNQQRAETTQSSSADSKCWPEVDATFDEKTYSVLTESTKDLSNIVLLFADGSTERFEDLSDKEGVFAGTGENTGKVLTGVWIKSGCNHSGDGPGYGEFVENPGTATNIPVISIGDAPGVIEPRLAEIVEVLFEVTLSEMVPLGGDPVLVSYATRDGTATAGMDYFPADGVLTFGPGEISQTISVFVIDDFDVELFEELFYVDLSSPENALLGNVTGTGTIIDDEEEG